MNTKIALKALKFAFLPTITILIFMIVGCFSFIEPFKFLISDSTGAIWLRVVLVISEIAAFVIAYCVYFERQPMSELNIKVGGLEKSFNKA